MSPGPRYAVSVGEPGELLRQLPGGRRLHKRLLTHAEFGRWQAVQQNVVRALDSTALREETIALPEEIKALVDRLRADATASYTELDESVFGLELLRTIPSTPRHSSAIAGVRGPMLLA